MYASDFFSGLCSKPATGGALGASDGFNAVQNELVGKHFVIGIKWAELFEKVGVISLKELGLPQSGKSGSSPQPDPNKKLGITKETYSVATLYRNHQSKQALL